MFCTILIVLLIIGVIGSLAYLHNVGLPTPLKKALLEELEDKNIHLSYESLKYKFNDGLVAETVNVYKTENHEVTLYSAEKLSLNIDKTKLLRGVLEIDSATVNNGQVSVPVVSNFPESPIINIDDFGGTFSISKNQQVESEEGLTFHYEGVKVVILGRAWKTAKKESSDITHAEKKTIAANYLQFRELIRSLKWHSETPPTITLSLDGDISDIKELQLDFEIQATDLQYKQAQISDLIITGSLNRRLVRLTELSFSDKKGSYQAQADLSLALNKGTFSFESSVDFKNLINAVTGSQFASKMKFQGESKIQATGSIDLPFHTQDGTYQPFKVTLLGEAELNNVSYLEANIDYLSSQFSWQDNSLFLDNLEAYSGDSEFNGRLLMDQDEIKFSTTSSLSPQLFTPFLGGLKIDKILNQLKIDDKSIANISAQGVINRPDLSISHIKGDLYVANITYRDTLIKEGSADFQLDGSKAIYSNASIQVDHSNWSKQQQFGTGEIGVASAEQVKMSRDPETGWRNIELIGLTTDTWPAPIVRLFHLKAYKLFSDLHLEAPLKINKSNLQFKFNPPLFHTLGDINLPYAKLSGTAIHNTTFKLDLTPGKSDLTEIITSVDYVDYKRTKLHGGPKQAKISIDKVSLQKEIKTKKDLSIFISGVNGDVWPAPLTAMFAPKAAKNIETLNFTRSIKSNDSDVSVLQKGEKWNTNLSLDLASIGYNNVNASNATGAVSISDGETEFKDVTLTIDYSNSNEYKQNGGISSAKASVDSVVIGDNYASFTQLKGTVWPGCITSMFNTEVAKTLEDISLTTPIKCINADMNFHFGKKQLTTGKIQIGSFSYDNTPINSASFHLRVSDDKVAFESLEANLNYSSYKMRKEFSGPSSSGVKAHKITFLTNKDMIQIDKLRGNFWPGAAVGIFNKEVAEYVDDFRFATPPYTSTSGVLDIRDNATATNLTTDLSAGKFRYNFLDSDVPGSSIKANIKTTSNSVTASKIRAEVFNSKGFTNAVSKKYISPLSGNFTLFFNKKVPSYTGDLALNQLDVSSIAKVYNFEDLKTGKFSTLLQFKGDTSGVKTLSTTQDNTFILEKSDIATIPLLGPFSRITSTLGKNSSNERLGYSKISTASALYSIVAGELQIKNLVAKSASLSLKGTGKYNLDSERVSMKFELSGFKKGISFLELIRPLIKNFPIIKGIMRYKVYGQLDDLKILPDI